MFGNIGQIAGLLKNAGKIKESIKAVNDRLQAARFVGEAAGGQVRATVDGRGDVIALKIEPDLVKGGDVEMMEDLVVAAFRDAIKRSREGAAKEAQSAADEMGINVPGLSDMLGGLH